MTLHINARSWLNYAYLRDSTGAFNDSTVELDREIRSAFPEPASRYPDTLPGYLVVEADEILQSQAQIAGFFEWLTRTLTARTVTAESP